MTPLFQKHVEKKKSVLLRLVLTFQYKEASCLDTQKKLSINFSVYFKLNQIRQSTFFVDYQNGSETYKRYQVLVQ